MSTTTRTEKPWDFSNVIDLVNTLSTPSKPLAVTPRTTPRSDADRLGHSLESSGILSVSGSPSAQGLGDFSSIWRFLGTPADAAPPKVPLPPPANTTTSASTQLSIAPGILEYTSDGAVYKTSQSKKSKSIQWRDEAAEGALTDVAPEKSDESDENRLSKKQRYKRNKRERQRLAKVETPAKVVSDIESEADVPFTPTKRPEGEDEELLRLLKTIPGNTAEARRKRADMRTARAMGLNATSVSGQVNAPQAEKQKKTGKTVDMVQNAVAAVANSKAMIGASKPHIETPTQAKTQDAPPPTGKSAASGLARTTSEAAGQSKAVKDTQKTHRKQWPVSTPYTPKKSGLLPSTVQPSKPVVVSDADQQAPNSLAEATAAVRAARSRIEQTPTKSSRHAIQPMVVRSGDDRHWAFLLKLISNFYEDRGDLIRPANLSNHNNDPKGIHVFVDASNIFIGFHDQLKRSRNIPQHARVPRVDMSFDALSLLMERRRPVAKRVLAGSTPEVAAFDIARKIGYECSILDKVYKARELTERQRYFAELENKRNDGRTNGHHHKDGHASAGSSSESTSPTPTHAPEKFVEQGVDEILHLKILESIIDVDEPSTIVLATGDAAQAEYSQGFMVMVERALKKHWRVELVSWSKSINQMYKKPAFRKQWGDKFKVIELDDYAEELLDM